jgi:catechol 2,3-dioxygenase-like lactoylglutathione lyase family enzyme
MFSHIELNVTDLAASTRFYLLALEPLGFRVADQVEGIGLSHFALAVDSSEAVDAVEAHLAAHGIPLLGEGKLHADYRGGYTTLAFEDPDRIMVEIAHADPHYYSFDPP